MIDFIRIRYKDKSVIEPFVCDEKNFKELNASLEFHSGEVRYPKKVYIKNIEIVVTDTSVYLKNSLHKLYNILDRDENHNHNDFDYKSLCFTIDFLCNQLVDLDSAYITQLEFGLNIKTCMPAETIISNNILMHQFKAHNRDTSYNGRGRYKQFEHTNYIIKVYDKAKQFGKPDNILRFEIKFTNKRDFNTLGIRQILDLKSKINLTELFNYLIKRFDELLIVDSLDSKVLSTDKIRELEALLNHNHWQELYADRKNRNKLTKDKKTLYALLEKHDLLTTKVLLRRLLDTKFKSLIK